MPSFKCAAALAILLAFSGAPASATFTDRAWTHDLVYFLWDAEEAIAAAAGAGDWEGVARQNARLQRYDLGLQQISAGDFNQCAIARAALIGLSVALTSSSTPEEHIGFLAGEWGAAMADCEASFGASRPRLLAPGT